MGLNVIDWTQANATVQAMEEGETKQLVTAILPAFQASVEAIVDSANADVAAQREALMAELATFRDDTIAAFGKFRDETVAKLTALKIGVVD